MIQFRRVYCVAAILMFGMSLAAETLPDNAVELDRQRFGIVPEGRYVYITNGVYRGSLIPAKLGAYAPITNRLNSVRSDYGYRELMGTNEYSCGCVVFCCDYLDSTMPPGAAVVYVDTSGVMNWFSDADGRKAAWTIFGLRKRGVGGPAGPSYHRCGLYEYFPDADRLRFLRSRGKDALSDFKEIERLYDEELPLTDIKKALRICNSYQGLRLPSRLPWKDGSLCGWPECKKIHPILDAVDFLGGYYNDDGINLMHDDFFAPKAEETKALLDLCERERADIVIHLHGGGDSKGNLMQTSYMSEPAKAIVEKLAKACFERGKTEELEFAGGRACSLDDGPVPGAFNLASAVHHKCGAVSFVYESNECIIDEPGPKLTHGQITRMHMIVFEEALRILKNREYRYI